MKNVDPDVEDQLTAGSMTWRDAILFKLDEGDFGFYAGGRGILTDPATDIDYVGSGSLISMQVAGDSTSQDSAPITVTVASKYQVDGVVYDIFDTGLLLSIESSNWFRRTAVIHRIWLDSDLRIIEFEQRAIREIHQVIHTEDPNDGYTLQGILETPSIFRTQIEGKKRNQTLQVRLDGADQFLNQLTTTANQKFYWGRLPPKD